MRPLSRQDLCAIAEYLHGTDEELWIALSELGYDPYLYDETELAQWIEEETGVFKDSDGSWWKLYR